MSKGRSRELGEKFDSNSESNKAEAFGKYLYTCVCSACNHLLSQAYDITFSDPFISSVDSSPVFEQNATFFATLRSLAALKCPPTPRRRECGEESDSSSDAASGKADASNGPLEAFEAIGDVTGFARVGAKSEKFVDDSEQSVVLDYLNGTSAFMSTCV